MWLNFMRFTLPLLLWAHEASAAYWDHEQKLTRAHHRKYRDKETVTVAPIPLETVNVVQLSKEYLFKHYIPNRTCWSLHSYPFSRSSSFFQTCLYRINKTMQLLPSAWHKIFLSKNALSHSDFKQLYTNIKAEKLKKKTKYEMKDSNIYR